MGLFRKSTEAMVREALKNTKPITKMVTCPKCHKRYTVTFLSSGDSKRCDCGYRIYCS